MSATSKIALGVAGGYLLGRTRKLRLAITLGSVLAGQRVLTDRASLLKLGAELVDRNPELAQIRDQIMSELMQSARAAAITTATSRLQNVTRRLEAGTGGGRDQQKGEYDDSDSDEYDEYDDQHEYDVEDDEDVEGEHDAEDDEDVEDEYHAEEDQDAEEEDEEPEPPRRRRRGR